MRGEIGRRVYSERDKVKREREERDRAKERKKVNNLMKKGPDTGALN